jgi:ATP-dependent DNA helicase DinG
MAESRISFDGRGPLAAAIRARGGNPSVRTAQQDYVRQLERCLSHGWPALIDAETGVGKTLGYLIPMMEAALADRSGKRPLVVVSTATVALQQQVLSSDLPLALDAIERAYGVHLSGALRVGRGQVVDGGALIRAAETVAGADLPLADEMFEWCEERLGRGELPLRSDLMEAFADRFTAPPGWLSADLIGLWAGPGYDSGAVADLYAAQIETCERADVLVVNHHLLSLHLLRPFLWSDDRSVHLVVDEADRFPDIVESIRRTQVPMHALLSAAKILGRDSEPVEELIGTTISQISALWDGAWEGAGGGVVPLTRVDPRKRMALVSTLSELGSRLTGAVRFAKDLHSGSKDREILATLERYAGELDRMVKSARMGDLSRSVVYFSPVRRYPGVAVVANGAARMIAGGLWRDNEQVRSLLFTSATLSTLAQGPGTPAKRALAAFANSVGFRPDEVPIDAFAVIAPHRFGEMEFVRPLLDAPVAFVAREGEESVELSDAALDYWSEMVGAAHNRGGRTLVLLPSYRDVLALTARLERFGEDLIAQVPGYMTGAAVRRFLDRDRSVWVSATAWEGVSLPGAISHIVIPRLPIRPLTFEDSVVQAYVNETYGAGGRSVIFARQMADARRRLRQGVGRGIRSHDDKVTIWIGDPRWPLSQREADEMLLDQPRDWSGTMANAISARFRRKLESSPRYDGG